MPSRCVVFGQIGKFTQTMATHVCDECVILPKENRLLRNKLIDEKQTLAQEKKISAELRSSKCLQSYLGLVGGTLPHMRFYSFFAINL